MHFSNLGCMIYASLILSFLASEEDLEAKLGTGRLRVRKVFSSDSSEEEPGAHEKENIKTKKVSTSCIP